MLHRAPAEFTSPSVLEVCAFVVVVLGPFLTARVRDPNGGRTQRRTQSSCDDLAGQAARREIETLGGHFATHGFHKCRQAFSRKIYDVFDVRFAGCFALCPFGGLV